MQESASISVNRTLLYVHYVAGLISILRAALTVSGFLAALEDALIELGFDLRLVNGLWEPK